MIIFFAIILGYLGLVFIIGQAVWEATASSPVLVGYWLLSLAWIISSVIAQTGRLPRLTRWLQLGGSYWLAFFFYLALGLGLGRILGLLPRALLEELGLTGVFSSIPKLVLGSSGLALIVTSLGALNARRLKIRYHDFREGAPYPALFGLHACAGCRRSPIRGTSPPIWGTSPGFYPSEVPAGEQYPKSVHSLKIVFFADLHLGVAASANKTKKLVEKINHLAPDLILIGGDLIDISPKQDHNFRLGSIIKGLRARLGVYAVPGNHEYIQDPLPVRAWYREAGIRLLEDEAARLNELVILGRRDWAGAQHGLKRASLETIYGQKKVKENDLVIIIDHQPRSYREAEALGARLVLSGHTHLAQIWPLNWITRLLFENHYGLLVRGGTRFLTTAGASTWGPPVRTNSCSELVVIEL